MNFFKLRLEFIHFAGFFNILLQLGNFKVVSVKSAMFIKYLRKHTKDRSIVLVDGALGVNIKQNSFRRNTCAVLQLSIHHRIVKLVRKVSHRFLPANGLVSENIGEHLQKVRFTASKEARDPNADFISRIAQRLFIVIQKGVEMLAKLAGNNILLELLFNDLFIVLCNFDNTVNIAVNVVFVNIF